MKKRNFLIGLSLLSSGLICAQEEQTTTPSQPTEVVWDIMNRNFGEDWESAQDGIAGGSILWVATVGKDLKPKTDEWSVTPKEEDGLAYINLLKTGTAATNYTAIINSTGGGIKTISNTAYTYEYKVRIHPIDTLLYPLSTGYEMNVLSARLNGKVTDVYFSRERDGREYIGTKLDKDNWNNPISDKVYMNIDFSQWHVYRFILAEDAQTFDFYVDGKLMLENITPTNDNRSNLLKFGTASERSRVDMDIVYAKMATGAWIPEPEEDPTVPTFQEEIAEKMLSVYPTVLHRGGQFTVTTQAENVEVTVFDFSGKQLSTTNACTAIAPMNPGMYIVKVSADGILVEEQKIVVIE